MDSFENSQYYICFQNNNNLLDDKVINSEYVILQKSSHPDFNIKKNDTILYCRTNGELVCEKIEYISLNFIKTYYTRNDLEISSQPIFESQIIGKVVGIIENNIWNSISIKCWELSINSLNLRSLHIKL